MKPAQPSSQPGEIGKRLPSGTAIAISLIIHHQQHDQPRQIADDDGWPGCGNRGAAAKQPCANNAADRDHRDVTR